MVPITLTPEEDDIAVRAGKARQARAVERGVARDRLSLCPDVEGGHIDGVRGELVVCKLLGVPWRETTYTKGESDLQDLGIEARLRRRHWYEMFLLKKDADDRLFILITKEQDDPEYRVHGCILGVDGKKPEYWKQIVSGNPYSFFIPRKVLPPIEDLLAVWPRPV